MAGSFSLTTQEGDLLACAFLTDPIAKVFNALQEQLRENQKNHFLAQVTSIAGDSNSNGEPWGDQRLFRRGHIKGEVDFDGLTKVIHGDYIDVFLNLPDRLQREIADQVLNFSEYGKDVFNQEQLSFKELRMLLTLVKHQAASVY